jgi:nucleotidyltransferase substrate binding protein (TIGR01987 family)
MDSQPAVIHTIARHIGSSPNVDRVVLFGSRSRGDARERSDIDLAVVGPDITDREWLEMREYVEEEAPTLLLIDLVRWEEVDERLRYSSGTVYAWKALLCMPDARLRQFLEDWVDAQDRLEEVLSVSPETWQLPFPLSLGTLLRDAVLLRFVFVYDLAWHTMTVSPWNGPGVLQQAYRSQWIEDEGLWLRMVNDRNLVAHTYREATALEVYQRVKDDYAPHLRQTYEMLKSEVSDQPT